MAQEIDLLNNFFQRFDLTDVEFKLKQRCQMIKGNLDLVSAELQTKKVEVAQKEEDSRALTYKLDSLLQFIVELEKDRNDKLAIKG